jgi:hypothetical protein
LHLLEILELDLQIFVFVDEFFELEGLLVEALGSIFAAELSQPVLECLVLVSQLPNFLLQLGELNLLVFKKFLRGSN